MMNRLPTQDNLLDLHNKIRNTTYKGKENKERDKSLFIQNCEKSERSERRVSLLPTLTETHQTILRRVRYCQRHKSNADRFQKGQNRLVRTLSREYLPALEQLNGLYERQALMAERDNLEHRLNRGFAMEDSDNVARTFTRLLTQYEILSDALDGNVIDRYMDRVNGFAGHV